jgi:hypothetical protein
METSYKPMSTFIMLQWRLVTNQCLISHWYNGDWSQEIVQVNIDIMQNGHKPVSSFMLIKQRLVTSQCLKLITKERWLVTSQCLNFILTLPIRAGDIPQTIPPNQGWSINDIRWNKKINTRRQGTNGGWKRLYARQDKNNAIEFVIAPSKRLCHPPNIR